jgi:hypothetical protein
MEIVHITLTAMRDSRLPLFPTEEAYLDALHRIGAVCGGCLALFALLAEHLHLVALLSRARAGHLARGVLLTLRPIVATPLAPSYIKPVTTRAHMRWLLKYMLEQPREHGMSGHPALWVGSCLPDLVGARAVPGLDLCIERAMPDFSQAAATSLVGLSAGRIEAADHAVLRAVGAMGLRDATAASLAVPSALDGATPADILGRRAFAQLAKRVGLHRSEVVNALGINPKSMWRLARPPVEQKLLDAIARRVTLEQLVARAALAELSGRRSCVAA